MFRAYFDESGTHKASPVISVSGFLSTVDQWERFENEWQEILNGASIPFFHMADYENHQSPYNGWSDFKRKRVIEQLTGAAKRRIRIPISATVFVADYEEVFGPSPKLSPYGFCALQCLARIGEWADAYRHYEPIDYIFESGPGCKHQLNRINSELSGKEVRGKRYRFGNLTVEAKRQVKPLQAADILAYETFKEMMNSMVPGLKRRLPRLSAIALLDGHLTEYCGFYTKENLQSPTTYVPPTES